MERCSLARINEAFIFFAAQIVETNEPHHPRPAPSLSVCTADVSVGTLSMPDTEVTAGSSSERTSRISPTTHICDSCYLCKNYKAQHAKSMRRLCCILELHIPTCIGKVMHLLVVNYKYQSTAGISLKCTQSRFV